ncbi:hypothetical protein BAE44_0008431 [Dichanthelium oligosanthes]|uniref:FBD domain-containing protein n=1 Tax=Dichanthelium oligosanthes TaxID=888268 RepID=A0A1E5VZR7_9POAL|nr:hypothetical protein BAE44_0008431 [Dichanthelium oligosanthes]
MRFFMPSCSSSRLHRLCRRVCCHSGGGISGGPPPTSKLMSRTYWISRERIHGTLDERWAQFDDFATNLLLFHDNTTSLDEFWLFSYIYNQRHLDRLIRRGVQYRPAVLHILILEYDRRFKLSSMANSSFHRLKTLRLRNVDLNTQFADLLSACPVKEDLELKDRKFPGNCSQVITLPTLRKMILSCCENNASHPLVMLDTNSDTFPVFPNMRTMRLISCFLYEYDLNGKLEALGRFLENPPCLEKLILRHCMDTFGPAEFCIKGYGGRGREICAHEKMGRRQCNWRTVKGR